MFTAQWRIQDFPEGGAWTLQGGHEHAKFSRKLHEIERIWTPRGGRASLTPPPRSANAAFSIYFENTQGGSWHRITESGTPPKMHDHETKRLRHCHRNQTFDGQNGYAIHYAHHSARQRSKVLHVNGDRVVRCEQTFMPRGSGCVCACILLHAYSLKSPSPPHPTHTQTHRSGSGKIFSVTLLNFIWS